MGRRKKEPRSVHPIWKLCRLYLIFGVCFPESFSLPQTRKNTSNNQWGYLKCSFWSTGFVCCTVPLPENGKKTEASERERLVEMNIVKKRVALSAVLILFLFCLFGTGVYLKRVADYKKAVKDTTLNGVDVSKISDGIYRGEYDVNFIYAKVEVTIQNGSIKDIVILEHKNGRGESAEIIADKIVEEQRTDVDAVSGATNSSVVIKKAVENALYEK